MQSSPRPHGHSDVRIGFSLMELTVAVAVFAMLLATAMQMFALVSSRMRANERRLVALQGVQAVSEQIGNIPWDTLSTATASQVSLPESAVARLPGAELKLEVHDETSPIAKRITVGLSWAGSGADRAGPVRLTSWVFPENAASAR